MCKRVRELQLAMRWPSPARTHPMRHPVTRSPRHQMLDVIKTSMAKDKTYLYVVRYDVIEVRRVTPTDACIAALGSATHLPARARHTGAGRRMPAAPLGPTPSNNTPFSLAPQPPPLSPAAGPGAVPPQGVARAQRDVIAAQAAQVRGGQDLHKAGQGAARRLGRTPAPRLWKRLPLRKTANSGYARSRGWPSEAHARPTQTRHPSANRHAPHSSQLPPRCATTGPRSTRSWRSWSRRSAARTWRA